MKELDLSDNYLSDINILDKVNFKELEELDLSDNKFSICENFSIIKNLELKILNFYV